jgi:hypothetical protein
MCVSVEMLSKFYAEKFFSEVLCENAAKNHGMHNPIFFSTGDLSH